MKRRGITGILVTVMAIFCFFFDGQAVELTPGKPQRAIQTPIQTQPTTPKLTLLPDLIVEKVWLNERNQIVFMLKNAGRGNLMDDAYLKGVVRVTFGVSHKDYALKMVDPGKALVRSGGGVSFTTEIELRESTRVMVEVDNTRQIAESREDNNLLSASLIPRVAKPPAVKGVKVTKPAEGKPSEVVSRGEPLIKATKIYQKEGRLHIVFKNEGQGKISERDFHQGRLVIRYGDKSMSFLLRDVDPSHRLDTPGQELEFNTGISIETKLGEAQLPVNISFYDLKDTKITPMDGSIPIQPQPKIIVYQPFPNDQIFRLCDWWIRWRRVGEMNTRVRIKILDESGNLLKAIPEAQINNPGENSYSCNTWPTSPKGKVKVRVETIDGAVWGESGVFELIPQPTIEVLRPEEGEIYYPGGKIFIQWHTKGKLQEEKVNISLLRPDNTPELKIYNISSPSYCLKDGYSNFYTFNIPETIKPGYYRISVTDSLLSSKGKNSGIFQISGASEPKKPDFVWVMPELKDRIHGRNGKKLAMVLKNIGGKFVGNLDVRIKAVEANIEKTETLVFTEQNPFYPNMTTSVWVGPFDWPNPKLCSLLFMCQVDPNQKISELNKNNNMLMVETYHHWSTPHFFILDDRITLTSGWDTWEFKETINYLRLDSTKGMELGLNSVSMDVSFYGTNCSSGEPYAHNPRIVYYDRNCQLKEEDFGPTPMRPGETKAFGKTIHIGLCKNSSIKIKIPGVTYEVRIEFTDKFLTEARPRPHPLPDRIYKPSKVQLVFARGAKDLPNGGGVTLEKGDWMHSYPYEYAIDFIVKARLKANAPYRTRLTLKGLSSGLEFIKRKEVEFEPEKEIELVETIKICPSWYGGLLQIIDETGNKEIFNGIIYYSDSLRKEIWRPWLHISQNLYIYLNNQKKEVTIKCYVFNSEGPVKNQRWWLNLEIKYHNQRIQSKTWQFDEAPSKQLIEKTFTFKPIYDGEHIYKIKLTANNKNILTNRPDELERMGSFNVPSSW